MAVQEDGGGVWCVVVMLCHGVEHGWPGCPGRYVVDVWLRFLLESALLGGVCCGAPEVGLLCRLQAQLDGICGAPVCWTTAAVAAAVSPMCIRCGWPWFVPCARPALPAVNAGRRAVADGSAAQILYARQVCGTVQGVYVAPVCVHYVGVQPHHVVCLSSWGGAMLLGLRQHRLCQAAEPSDVLRVLPCTLAQPPARTLHAGTHAHPPCVYTAVVHLPGALPSLIVMPGVCIVLDS
jgi:hypothetical protein